MFARAVIVVMMMLGGGDQVKSHEGLLGEEVFLLLGD